MSTLQVAGESIPVNAAGYLTNFDDWNEDVAKVMFNRRQQETVERRETAVQTLRDRLGRWRLNLFNKNLERAQRYRMALFDMHKPSIAQVHGYCLAGGTDIALLCDMVIAADDATFGFPPARDLCVVPGPGRARPRVRQQGPEHA